MDGIGGEGLYLRKKTGEGTLIRGGMVQGA